MQTVRTIIELNTTLTDFEKKELVSFFSKKLYASKLDIQIYDAKSYAQESEFSLKVYEEVKNEFADDYYSNSI